MQSTQNIGKAAIGATVLALVLSGCGAGAGVEDAPAADAGTYQQIASYCQTTPPGPGEAVRDGWVMNSSFSGYTGRDSYRYETNAIISANGSTAEGLGPVSLKVGVYDYRGLASNAQFITPGYANPATGMGAVLSGTMSAKSVACVAQLAKIGWAAVGATMHWRSFWNDVVPMSQLPGYQIDGFEFVGNFNPADGRVYFILEKQRHPAPQAYSVCYLAPGTTQWKCSQPELSDQGATWQVGIRGLAQGVYVLNAPNMPG